MKIFLLSGKSIWNKEWIEEVNKEFEKEFLNTEIIYYTHWNLDRKEIDLNLETKKLVEKINYSDEEYLVFAKSIGTIVFFNAIDKIRRKPLGVLMIGVPRELGLSMGVDFKDLRDKVDYRIDIYQKELDPFANLNTLIDVSGDSVCVYKYECIGEENDNHHYSNMKYLLELIKRLL